MTFRLTTPPRKPPANRKAKSNALTDTDSARLSHGGELSTSSCHILLMVLAAIGILASGAGSVSLLVVRRLTGRWLVRIALSFFGLTMIVSILVVSTFKKFAEGGKDHWKAESLRLTN